MLDELNKYAPREGSSPIKEVLLDIAERGRSLGVVLIGAQQTASEVERRIVTNSAVRVVGRLDPAEASRPEYGFLPPAQRQRVLLAKPGTMFVNQPDIPVPLCLEFPFPAWATRHSEAGPAPAGTLRSITQSADPFAVSARDRVHCPTTTYRSREGLTVRILHTSDWHVGKVLKGQSRVDEHVAVLAQVVEIARAEQPDLVIVAGDLYDTAAPSPESTRLVTRALSALRRTGADVVAIGGNHDNGAALDALRPWADAAGITLRGSVRDNPAEHVIEGTTATGERWRLVALPFLSQRYAVRAVEMYDLTAAEATQTYADHLSRLIGKLTEGFGEAGVVNLVTAHLTVVGASQGGGERESQTVLGYAVPATVFPTNAHYVALGHLHRAPERDRAVPGALQRQPARDRLRRGRERARGHDRRRHRADGREGARGAGDGGDRAAHGTRHARAAGDAEDGRGLAAGLRARDAPGRPARRGAGAAAPGAGGADRPGHGRVRTGPAGRGAGRALAARPVRRLPRQPRCLR